MDPSGFEGVTRSEAQHARPAAVRVWLLGGFGISVGRRTIEGDAWRLRKAAALVKLLALAPDHRLHREQVMDLLWPVSNRRAASNNLRQALHGARRALSSDPAEGSYYLSSEGESLVLCPRGDLRVDVEAFEEAVETARRSRDPATCRAAIELYSGDLLPEDRYEEWTEDRRENLRQMYLALLIELAGLYEERGQHRLAIVTLLKAVAEEPTFEEAHASLMRQYTLSGRPGEALAQYERLREAFARRLGTEPDETLQKLRDDIAEGIFSSDQPQVGLPEEPPATARHNLPAARTSFIGREQEMVEIKRELAMTRLLTLTGAGGTGKTRLALEVARELVGAHPDGVWLVELAGLSDGTLVPQALAATLEVQEQADQSLTDTLTRFLREKKVLLVLDNCEHLLDAAARLADTLLDSCPRLTVVATSRESLGIAGEVDRPVPALAVPDVQVAVEELERYESVRLFAERALFVERTLYGSSGFALGSDNVQTVAEICSRLEGIPLAIELAAAWVGTLTVDQISERLKDSLTLLKSGSRTITPRQRTLQGAMDWSYNLLSEPNRILFRRLSVFAGGWTLEAAEAVSTGDGIEKVEVLELLWELVNKSLVVAESGTQGAAAARYRMLEPVRQYAREKLEEMGEADGVRVRHTAFFLALAEEAEPELAGAQQRLWMERLGAEYDNLRVALSGVLEGGEGELALRLGAALWRFWHVRGYLSEGIRWIERILAEGEPAASPARVKALEGMGWLVQFQGDPGRARVAYEKMLELSRELGDKGNVATALNSLGTVAAQQGDNERARTLLQENLEVIEELEEEGNPATTLKRFYVLNLLGYLAIYAEGDYVRGTTLWEESLALAREAGDDYWVGLTLANLGFPALLQGEYERAKATSEEALAFSNELGSSGAEIAPLACVNLGLAALGLGEHKRAIGSFEEALVMSQEMGRKPQSIESLEGMASLAADLGKASRAAHLWGAAEAAREVTGIPLSPVEWALHKPHLGSARSQLGEAGWEEALAAGREMSLEEAAEYALSAEPDQPEATSAENAWAHDEPMGNLTRREQEVAILLARGLTNRQIAKDLSISERTAGNHVAKILKKVGLHSRAQIATWAIEGNLLTPRPD